MRLPLLPAARTRAFLFILATRESNAFSSSRWALATIRQYVVPGTTARGTGNIKCIYWHTTTATATAA